MMTRMNVPQPFEYAGRHGELRGWFNQAASRHHDPVPCVLRIDCPGMSATLPERIWTELTAGLTDQQIHVAQFTPSDPAVAGRKRDQASLASASDASEAPFDPELCVNEMREVLASLSEQFPIEQDRIGILGLRQATSILLVESLKALTLECAAFVMPEFGGPPMTSNASSDDDSGIDVDDLESRGTLYTGAANGATSIEDLSPPAVETMQRTDVLLVAGAAAEEPDAASEQMWWMQTQLMSLGWPASHELIARTDEKFSNREAVCAQRLIQFYCQLTQRRKRTR
ncbi:MAG: hypothetical protein EA377_13385 [Phycisphaerales bacterium]|nr:MAG: hypothetical protein EA377_13385 [Phycisphaerales bacterium]